MRMIAGPNGAGKSTLKEIIGPELVGVYVNADEIEKALLSQNGLRLELFGLSLSSEEITERLANSNILSEMDFADIPKFIKFSHGAMILSPLPQASYFASAVAELLRNELVKNRVSCTFETVMSHKSKAEFLCHAKDFGFRTYLYYIATESPEINIRRVANRVLQNGHNVPEDKIRSRYFRSLENLTLAIKCADRSYIFDNSREEGEQNWLAEFENGTNYEYKTSDMPAWFIEYVDSKFN